MGAAGGVLAASADSDQLLFDSFRAHLPQLGVMLPSILEREEHLKRCNLEDGIELIINDSAVLTALLLIIGRERVQAAFKDSYYDEEEYSYDLSDGAGLAVANIEDVEGLEDLMRPHIEGMAIDQRAVGLNLSCSEALSELSPLAPFLTDTAHPLLYLNVSNTPTVIQGDLTCPLRGSALQHLHMGGSGLAVDMGGCVSRLPPSLLTLDVAFTDALVLPPGVFTACPQLISLCIDGCGLSSTTHVDGSGSRSVFEGLVCLRHLSMRENAIGEVRGLEGVSYFKAQSLYEDETVGGCRSVLRRIDIAENPLCEHAAVLLAAQQWLSTAVPTLRRLDSRFIGGDPGGQMQFVPGSVIGGGMAVTDNMEREFMAAVRGDAESTVVT